MEYEGDPPEGPTLRDIQNFTQDVTEMKFIQVVAFDEQFWVTLSEEGWNASDPPAQVLKLREKLSDALSHDYAREARNLYSYLSLIGPSPNGTNSVATRWRAADANS